MALPSNIKQIILDCIKSILTCHYTVYLFGSYAKGKATKFSDIDIAIKCKNPLEPAKWAMIDEELKESSIVQKVDIIDYHRVKDDFKMIIDVEGIQLK